VAARSRTQWTDAPPTANPPALKEHIVNNRIRWGQAPTGWDTSSWAPLVDPSPLPTVHSVGRWLWFTAAVGGFLLVTGFTFAHDDPTPGLSTRGLLTIALAAVVVVLLTIRRTAGPGPLARAMAEYAVVFLLATLVATTGISLDQPPTASDTTAHLAPDQRPALVKTVDGFRDWLHEWRTWAHKQTDRHGQAATPPLLPGCPLRPGGRCDPAVH
jgi:hypothetical protein